MKNRVLKWMAAGLGAATLMMGAVCVQAEDATEAASEAVTEAAEEAEGEDEENYNTGDASKDNPRNQDEIGEKELLVVSFGTSFNDNRVATIGAIENALEEAFPEFSVRRGFTAQIIIDHVKNRDGEVIDNFGEALNRAIDNGVKTLVVQPTHLMDGLEYNDVMNELAEYAEEFEQVVVGNPLLTSDSDYEEVIKAITEDTKDFDDGETAIVFMGHGTEAESNKIYATMQEKLTAAGFANYFVGTVEAAPSLDDVLAAVQAGEYKKVVLQPLMIVAGDHANNDMAGDEEGAWKKTFEDAGYEVTCNLKGLGEMPIVQGLLIEHAREAMEGLAE